MRILVPLLSLTVAVSALDVDVYFIRHGESSWNAKKTADKNERNNIITPEFSSPITATYVAENDRKFDAPLSPKGHWQTRDLGDAIFKTEGEGTPVEWQFLRDHVGSGDLILGVSNLARTQMTLGNFLDGKEDNGPYRVEILNCLQELSNGHDAKSTKQGRTNPSECVPKTMRGGKFEWAFGHGVTRLIDLNIFDFRGQQGRFNDFMSWLWYNASENPKHVTNFLVAGHSSWLQELFKTRLREKSDMNSVEYMLHEVKLGNGSMIKFTVRFPSENPREAYIVPGATVAVRDVLQTVTGEVAENKFAASKKAESELSMAFPA